MKPGKAWAETSYDLTRGHTKDKHRVDVGLHVCDRTLLPPVNNVLRGVDISVHVGYTYAYIHVL